MEVVTARDYSSGTGTESASERGNERDGDLLITAGQGGEEQTVGRHHPGNGGQLAERPGTRRGRRDKAKDAHRDESARGGYERAWHAMAGYETSQTTTVYDGAPHPISGYERLSVDRAHTMKDFEKQITELKKENFNLKLRIYFLEEQVKLRCDTSNDELHHMNIELKVEVESLKHDFQEKHNLLVRASKAMESLASQHDLAIQRLREEHLKNLQDLEDAHSHKVHVLENEIDHEKAELEKICVLLDQERMQRFNTEERLLVVNEQYTKSMGVLDERDWIIQCLNETVHSKDALIAQLEKQIASMMPYEAGKTGQNTSNLYQESDAKDLLGPPNPVHNVDVIQGKEENVNEWQKKIKEMDNLINELQQKLEANKAEEKNSIKRDKAIQGLTMALKKKTKENDKLLNDIDNLNAALAKAREVTQQAQLLSIKENIHPDYKKVIFTLQAEQDIYSRLLKYERESGSLQKELESISMLRKWLEESIRANQELRKVMEAQIMAKYRGDDSMSFIGDQTSYLSICLDHLDQNEYFFAGGPQGTALPKNNMQFGEAFREEAGTQTQTEVFATHYLDLPFSERNTVNGEFSESDAKPTRKKASTVSSATQTEPRTFSDERIPVNGSRLPLESAELTWTLQDGEINIPLQRHLQETSYKIQGEVYNSQNAKRSRLPVLLKSFRNTKLKIDSTLTPTKENDDCPEKEIEMENRRPYEQSVEIEVKSPKENKDLMHKSSILDRNEPGQKQKDPTEQATCRAQVSHRVSEERERADCEIMTPTVNEQSRLRASDLCNSSLRKSTEQALKALQAENEQLTRAQMEHETLKGGEDTVDHLSGFMKQPKETSDQNLQAEIYQLHKQLKQAQMDIERLRASEETLRCKECEVYNSKQTESAQQAFKELQEENDRLSEQLKQAQGDTKTLTPNLDSITHKDTLPDLSNSSKVQMEATHQTLQKDLQAENHRLVEQLQQAQREIETFKANEELLRCKTSELEMCNSKYEQRQSTEQALQKELQAENDRLSELLKQTQKDIETHKGTGLVLSDSKVQMEPTHQALQKELQRLTEQLQQAKAELKTHKANEELLRCKASELDLWKSKDEQRKSTDQALQKELQAENDRLSQLLQRAQTEIETLKAKHEDVVLNLTSSNRGQVESAERPLQAENYRLSEQLKQTQMEIEIHKAKELTKHSPVPGLSSIFKDQKESTDQALLKQLQAENYRLSEELKTAQMEIETLKANAALTKHDDLVLGVSRFSQEQVESVDRPLQKELQAENYRLSEQLKRAQMEIEKLQAEQRSSDGSDDSLKLHGSDADDDLSEQSFIDKTITNSVNVNEVDATSDFADEVCQPNVNSQNAVALRCHHDKHCTECANNRDIFSLPTSNSQRVSTMRTSSKLTKVSLSGRSFEDNTSLSKYDLLVQSQARELSLQRQKIKESHNLSVVCSKNFYNILKAFENLFPAGSLDSNITLGFREQVTQTVEWLKELEYKLSDALYGEEDAYSDHSVDSLLYTPSRLVPGHRMWADKHGCHVLGLVEDYNALRKQILEARNVLQEMEGFIDHGVQTAVLNMTDHFGNIFFEKLARTKQSLEEAGCLLKLLWRVSLPLRIHSPYNINQEEGTNLEVTRLRKRVLEQEKLLSGMVKRVYSENQMKEDIEKLIMDQLALTHDILKRAKGNLEVQVVDKLH